MKLGLKLIGLQMWGGGGAEYFQQKIYCNKESKGG